MKKQQTFSLDESDIQFLDRHQNYGFKDSSELVRTALQRFQLELEAQTLRESAELYAEIYAEEQDLQELTESALQEWPKQ
jgi:Arc/MetJ-type ribon-helix-helix transcriptional regulator